MNNKYFPLVLFLLVSVAVHLGLVAGIAPGARMAIGKGELVLGAKLIERARVKRPAIESDAATVESTDAAALRASTRQTSLAGSELSAHDDATSVPVLDDYLPTSLLTAPPSPIDSIDPTPPAYRLEGVVGEIELMVLISSDGDVDDVLLIGASLPMPFVEYAKAVFREARFTPGMVNATPVRSRVRIVLGPASDTAMTDATISPSMKSRR